MVVLVEWNESNRASRTTLPPLRFVASLGFRGHVSARAVTSRPEAVVFRSAIDQAAAPCNCIRRDTVPSGYQHSGTHVRAISDPRSFTARHRLNPINDGKVNRARSHQIGHDARNSISAVPGRLWIVFGKGTLTRLSKSIMEQPPASTRYPTGFVFGSTLPVDSTWRDPEAVFHGKSDARRRMLCLARETKTSQSS
jgi:hypothetical protein